MLVSVFKCKFCSVETESKEKLLEHCIQLHQNIIVEFSLEKTITGNCSNQKTNRKENVAPEEGTENDLQAEKEEPAKKRRKKRPRSESLQDDQKSIKVKGIKKKKSHSSASIPEGNKTKKKLSSEKKSPSKKIKKLSSKKAKNPESHIHNISETFGKDDPSNELDNSSQYMSPLIDTPRVSKKLNKKRIEWEVVLSGNRETDSSLNEDAEESIVLTETSRFEDSTNCGSGTNEAKNNQCTAPTFLSSLALSLANSFPEDNQPINSSATLSPLENSSDGPDTIRLRKVQRKRKRKPETSNPSENNCQKKKKRKKLKLTQSEPGSSHQPSSKSETCRKTSKPKKVTTQFALPHSDEKINGEDSDTLDSGYMSTDNTLPDSPYDVSDNLSALEGQVGEKQLEKLERKLLVKLDRMPCDELTITPLENGKVELLYTVIKDKIKEKIQKKGIDSVEYSVWQREVFQRFSKKKLCSKPNSLVCEENSEVVSLLVPRASTKVFFVNGVWGSPDTILNILGGHPISAVALDSYLYQKVFKRMNKANPKSQVTFEYLPSYFFPVNNREQDIDSLKPFMPLFPETDFHSSIIIAPLLSCNHFYLAVLNFPKKIIYVYDSSWHYFPEEEFRFHHVRNVLKHLLLGKSGDGVPPQQMNEWEIIFKYNCAQQIDDFSCGCYVIRFVENYLRGKPRRCKEVLTSKEVLEIRQDMARKLLPTTNLGRNILNAISY